MGYPLLEMIVVESILCDGVEQPLAAGQSAYAYNADLRLVADGEDERGEPNMIDNPVQRVSFAKTLAVRLRSRAAFDLEVVGCLRSRGAFTMIERATLRIPLPAGEICTIVMDGNGAYPVYAFTLSAFERDSNIVAQ